MRNRASDELGGAVVRDTGGNAHPLRELWSKRPALILWVRHFG
jgi:hypothetical protein